MIERSHDHEFFVALNGAFPESIENLRGELEGWLPQDRIRTWSQPGVGEPNDKWRSDVSELLRESFIQHLRPDIVHVASVFEGVADDATVSIRRFFGGVPVAVTHYDLIPHFYPEDYLPDERTTARYEQRLATLACADLFLAISDHSGKELVNTLGVDPASVVDIAAGVNPMFTPLQLEARERARMLQKYSLDRDFVLYTGGADGRKNIAGLMKAFSLLPGELREAHNLVLVGRMPRAEKERLQALAAELGVGGRLRIIEFVEDADLIRLYNLCGVTILPSLHEGFGLPLLEAMACGAPAIGANRTSIPEVLGRSHALFDPSSPEDMAKCLSNVLGDEAFADRLAKEGLAQATRFTWENSANLALRAMESLHAALRKDARVTEGDQGSEHQRWRKTLADVARHSVELETQRPLDNSALVELSACVANNFPSTRQRQLLLDVSELMINDGKSGIQRVVRAIIGDLLRRSDHGYDVKLVRRIAGGQYHYVRRDDARFRGLSEEGCSQGEPLEPRRGDVFLRLDLVLQGNDIELQRMRDLGVAVYEVIYDLLPVKWPEHFVGGMTGAFHRWLDETSRYADGVICISRAVADEFIDWLDGWQPSRPRPLKIGHFHLGADFEKASPTRGMSPDIAHALADREQHTFLMVGTVESRKGYDQVLDAFDTLWAVGESVRLVIVGRQGWLVDELARRLRFHAENGRRLFWLSDVSDEALLKLYAGSDALIMASRAEGFGLPLIEAARHGIRLIARDLPVFREVADDSAFYFRSTDGAGLAAEVQNWMEMFDLGEAPSSQGCKALDWSQSVDELLSVTLGGKWYRQWQPGRRYFLSPAYGLAEIGAGEVKNHHLKIEGQAGRALVSRSFEARAGTQRLCLKLAFQPSSADRSMWFEIVSLSQREVVCREWFEKACFDESGAFFSEFDLAADVDDLQFRIWVSPAANIEFISVEVTP
ncbi:MAG: glycosyltransferase family 4 protein, partial [Proteobacteria bacterium]|nr:glycosyltransferase family 4 protein [Pseudomonadota bacterium]